MSEGVGGLAIDLQDGTCSVVAAGENLLHREVWIRRNFEFLFHAPQAFLGNQLVDVKKNWCLDVPASDARDGLLLQSFPCHAGFNQLWHFSRDAQGFFSLQSTANPGKCLAAAGHVSQATCNPNQDNQKWFLRLLSGGVLRVQPKNPACLLLPTIGNPNPTALCNCIAEASARPPGFVGDGQPLRIGDCQVSPVEWVLGERTQVEGRISLYRDNNLAGDVLCVLQVTPTQYRLSRNVNCDDDEARSMKLENVKAGTVITLFDDTQCRPGRDDELTITVLRNIARYEFPTFERDYSDRFVRAVYRGDQDLDDAVSCIQIQQP